MAEFMFSTRHYMERAKMEHWQWYESKNLEIPLVGTLHNHTQNSEYKVVNDLLDSTTEGWN